MELKGIHHVSAMTANAAKNFDFYTKILGMRLIKKTVNQDDVSVYHLFYGDVEGNPGTEFTFFEIPMAAPNHNGNNSISEISLRVPNDTALEYWKDRFKSMNVAHMDISEVFHRKVLKFKDPEGQRLVLVSDEHNEGGVSGGTPWEKSPVPNEYGIIGLGPVKLTVPYLEPTETLLVHVMGFRKIGQYASSIEGQQDIVVYETGRGGTGAEVHVETRTDLPKESLGRGGVHHVAFRVDNDEELRAWIAKIKGQRMVNSGYVDRFYFHSLYFREPNGILFELATDGPGFATDESLEHLGEGLALPPFLEERRQEIEAKLKPLDTKQ
ncbi:glyoxalase family protein [Pullulanibacillus pueri]|uniref:Putative ring-cleaving dioxygenase MhqA n=1 Tax=Pullulanibacillus pueri TaxID=1437324 RepID=A0A8J2ZWV5_9BACL|nr:ring-cleaving dioxygenase [Pullulanibacillus pueri]MBM7680639.1 glyoxalase family protein [Pullulanibacillus pueri]GGH83863.1 putative ring-cleaving dioxygenase MhqA [Pullulanibacillus pueri]